MFRGISVPPRVSPFGIPSVGSFLGRALVDFERQLAEFYIQPVEVFLIEIFRRREDQFLPFRFSELARELEVQRHVFELPDILLVNEEHVTITTRADEWRLDLL